ncbi:MAG: hypothetical protein A4E64_02574 [Syntrophorhabdus sp. PtaU1.Bin058]|nr:MAG: hypothetical protein A4E64_02574 [Syntrophorhabdus sp. PtaU1.Bin058]
MVLIKDLLGALDIDAVFCRFAPRQFHKPFQVRPDHGGFDGVGVHHIEALELLFRLLLHVLRHLRLFDPLFQVLDLFGPFIAFAQLGPYGLHLFPEKIFPLRFRHLFLGLGKDLCLHVEELYLFSEDLREPFEAFHRIDDLEDLLCLVHCQPEVGGSDIGKLAGLIDRIEDHQYVGRDHPPHGDYLFHLFLHITHEGLDLEGDLRYQRLVDGLYLDQEGRGLLGVFLDPCLFQSLDQHLYPAVRQPQHPHDLGYDANRVYPVGERVFVGQILLGCDKDQPVLGQRFLYGIYRHIPSHKEREDHRGIHDHVPDRKERDQVRYVNCFNLCHGLLSLRFTI